MTPAQMPFSAQITSGDLLLFGFYGLLAVYIVFTAIFYYHWQTYSTDARISFITVVTYFVITIPLLITLSAVVIVT